jgi:hypothetical protein
MSYIPASNSMPNPTSSTSGVTSTAPAASALFDIANISTESENTNKLNVLILCAADRKGTMIHMTATGYSKKEILEELSDCTISTDPDTEVKRDLANIIKKHFPSNRSKIKYYYAGNEIIDNQKKRSFNVTISPSLDISGYKRNFFHIIISEYCPVDIFGRIQKLAKELLRPDGILALQYNKDDLHYHSSYLSVEQDHIRYDIFKK